MKRRLLLARALLHEPRLVILDEPTAGVDYELRLELWRYIRLLHERGTTILLTTHYLEEAEALCEEIALIRDGRIAALDTPTACGEHYGATSLGEVYVKAVGARRTRGGAVMEAARRLRGRRGVAAELRRLSYLSLFWLAARECLRVGAPLEPDRGRAGRLLAPVRDRVRPLARRPHQARRRLRLQVFILPGLVAMAMFTAAYTNNSSSIFQARNDRYIDDILAAPMLPVADRRRPHGRRRLPRAADRRRADRGRRAAAGRPDRAPAPAGRARCAAILLFASLGVIVGIYAQTWDHHSFVSNLVIQPLAFVGGVFYSVDVLPSPWQELSHANPLFYLVDAVRYGFLGTSDVRPGSRSRSRSSLAAALFAGRSGCFAPATS